MTFESIVNTRRSAGGTKYTTVSLSKELNIEADKICAELQCSKKKFVSLAMTKLIDEYHFLKERDLLND